ncbi:MAG: RluA family pseudouridine synthase [Provencibacterium sp.]|nr:RluA family pseudouridine synthase [Provencibacterium sp.]
MKQLIIGENDAGQRLDKFLHKAFPDLPSSLCYKYIRLKRIKVEGARARPEQKLQPGQRLSLYIADEFLGEAGKKPLFLSASGEVRVVYEDASTLLVDKPAGLLCHEDAREKRDTLSNRLLRYLYEKGEYDPGREQSFTPALCNRIDRNTQGLVMAAKTAAAQRELCEAIRERMLDKRYFCVARGKLPHSRDRLTGYHTKDSASGEVCITPYPRPGAKTAVTEYRVLAFDGERSLLEVLLHTGRTHQIRAQLAAIGHPLEGDAKYGVHHLQPGGLRFQALCSFSLRFHSLPESWSISYLSGREFQAGEVDFARFYFGDFFAQLLQLPAESERLDLTAHPMMKKRERT